MFKRDDVDFVFQLQWRSCGSLVGGLMNSPTREYVHYTHVKTVYVINYFMVTSLVQKIDDFRYTQIFLMHGKGSMFTAVVLSRNTVEIFPPSSFKFSSTSSICIVVPSLMITKCSPDKRIF